MARITKARVANYRSIGDPVEITFPRGKPVVLLGENNVGKSNIIKALELVLGHFWPGTHEPEDHEFFGRGRDQPIEINVKFDARHPLGGRYRDLIWRYDSASEEPVYFRGKPGQYGREDGYVSNDDRDTCVCVVLEADRNLRYHLSYTSKWTFLSRLMHRFHKGLLDQEETKSELERLFAQIKTKFGLIPEFAAFVHGLREQLASMVGTMTHRLEVDFEAYNPVNFFHALRLQAAEGNEPRTLDEMGTGEQQLLAMAFAYAYATAFHGGIVLVVEEPEAHLHPLAQEWLAKRLATMSEAGLQIVITTHSPAFVDVMNLEGLVLVRKGPRGTRVVQIDRSHLIRRCEEMGVPAGRATAENILPFYASAATREILEGFFSKVVVLVEGPSEALALPIYLNKCGLDVAREGISLTAVHGKGNLGKWRRLFVTYGIPCYVIFDNDGTDDGDELKRQDALRSVGVEEARHHQYTRTADWINEADFSVFGSDFEVAFRQHFSRYVELEEQARRDGVDTKPFIARSVAERIERNENEAGWQKLDQLARMIRNKLPV